MEAKRRENLVELAIVELVASLFRPLFSQSAACAVHGFGHIPEADIDGDGDLDVIITQPGRRARLLRNDQQLGHHWLRVKLVGRSGNRDAIGAWIEVRSTGATQRRRLMPTRSYLSQVELPVTFGLGDARLVDSLRVGWPDGSMKTISDVEVDREILVTQDND